MRPAEKLSTPAQLGGLVASAAGNLPKDPVTEEAYLGGQWGSERLHEPAGRLRGRPPCTPCGAVAPGAVALELWDGERWIVDELTTDDAAIREWIISHHRADTVTPWTPGTGRRRRQST